MPTINHESKFPPATCLWPRLVLLSIFTLLGAATTLAETHDHAASVASPQPPATPLRPAGYAGQASGPQPAARNDATTAEVLTRLRELEERLGEVRTVQTDFIQEKQLAVFARTVILEGRIALAGSQRLAWHVNQPVRHSLVLIGDRAQLWDEDTNRVHTIDLKSNPAFQAMYVQMRAWFAGEYQALAQDYAITVRQEDPLTFAFVPKPDRAMSTMLAEVTITVSADRRCLLEIVMVEAGGDRNHLRFLNTVLDEPIPEDVWKVPPSL